MNLFKKILAIAALVLLGGMLFASDQQPQTSTQSSVQPPSNPGECGEWICETPPTITEELTARGTTTLTCPGSSFDLSTLAKPAVEPVTSIGTLVRTCPSGSTLETTKDVKVVSWNWEITDDDGFDASTSGIYNITATGTAVFDTEDGDCTLETTHDFTVTVQQNQILSPTEITMCETLPVKLTCGKVSYVDSSDETILKVVDSTKVKGISAGTVTITVYTDQNEVIEGQVTVKDCRVIKRPKGLSTTIGFWKRECEEVTIGEGDDAEVVNLWVYHYYADFKYEKGKYIKCPDDDNGDYPDEEPVNGGNGINFGIEETEYTWRVGTEGNIVIYGDHRQRTLKVYTLNNAPLVGEIICTAGGEWAKCGDDGSLAILDQIEYEAGDPQPGSLPACEPTPFAPQNKYINLNIHGQPKSELKPQQEVEKDGYKSDFSVNAYHLSPSFSTADISIPLQGSDLRLELLRTNSTDVTTTQSANIDNSVHRLIMGRTWRVNIAPVVYYSGSSSVPNPEAPETPCETVSGEPTGSGNWVVVDDGGAQFKYSPAILEETQGFKPIKEYFSDHEASLHKLSGEPGQTMYFRKQNGMVFEYEHVNYSVADTDISSDATFTKTSMSNFHRCKSITDRTGNKIIYQYETADSLFPEKIYYEQNDQIFIEFRYNVDNTRLTKAIDSYGREINYNYTNGQLTSVVYPAAPVANPNNPKLTTDVIQQYTFTYGTVTIPSYKSIPAKTTHFMQSMTDPEGNQVSMTYTTFTETDDRKHVLLNSLTTPDGTFTSNISSINGLFRTVTISDTAGKVWVYNFYASSRENSYFIPKSGGGYTLSKNCEVLLNKFYREQYDSADFSRIMGASFNTEPNSAINLTSVTDYHGVQTKYIYGQEQVTYFRNGAQVTEEYDFSAYNQPYQEILDPTSDENPNGLNIIKEFGYESNTNQMVRIVDGNGNVSTYDLDDQGNRLREIAPEGKTTAFTYELGYQTSATDADGRRTVSKRIYGVDGWTDVNVVLLTYGDTRTYDDLNIDLETYSPINNDDKIVSVSKFNLVGKLVQTIDANWNVTDYQYDESYRLERTLLPAVDDYDTPGVDSTRPEIIYTRNKNRQVVGKRDPRGNWTLTEYDGMLRPEKVTVEFISDATKNIVTETEYDAAGNKSRVVDPKGTIYTFEYDAFNNLIKETKDVGGLEYVATYEYGEGSGNDVFGDTGFVPTRKVDTRGIVTLLEYDNAYRLIRTYRGYEGRETLLSQISYDNAGNVVSTIIYNNQVSGLSGEYFTDNDGLASGNQHTVTVYDGLNRPTATAIDLDGDGASVSDPDDIVTNTFYDTTGNVIISIDPEGHSTQTEYDAAGRVVKQVINLDDNPDFGLSNGNAYSIVADAEDIVTVKTYDDNGNVLTQTLINDTPGAVGNQTVTNHYDALNRVVSFVDPSGYQTQTKYDLNNNARYVKSPRGFDPEETVSNFETITEYDEANRAVTQTLPEVFNAEANNGAGSLENPVVQTFYDKNSNVVKTIDARGLVTVNVYDKINRLKETRQIVGADDRESTETNDIVTINEYDGNNNLIEATFKRDDVDLVTSTVYDSLDRPLITTDPEGFQSVVFCDLVGNKVKLFDKRANSLVVGGVETPQETPQLRYFTKATFDRANRMVKNTLPEIAYYRRTPLGLSQEITGQPFSEVEYLKNNWVKRTIDLNGNVTETDYDNAGRKEKVTNAINQETTFIYDKAGNILQQTVQNNMASGGNQVTSYTYDERNLLLTETLNPGHAELQRIYTYEYDSAGNKKTRTFPNEDETTYNYDGLNRLLSEVYANAINENRTYTYNNNGAVIKCIDNTGTVKYEYDILGRQILETKINTSGVTVSLVESVYDKANNRIRCYFPGDKKTLVSEYDKRNLLVTMKGYHGKVLPSDEGTYPNPVETTVYTYNANGNQLSITTPNGQITTKAYDNADRIISTTTSTNTINAYSASYKRDAVGNQLQTVETRSNSNGPATNTRTLDFAYDETYRLISETDDVTGEVVENTYIYDLQGNRLSRTQKVQGENDQDSWIYSNDILNRSFAVSIDLKGLNNSSSYSYTYDDNGNRKTRTYTNESGDVSTHTYFYDQENRLSKVTESGTDIFIASYDYRTRRTVKTEVNSQDLNETTAYVYDGGVSCQEFKVTNPGDEYDGSNASLAKQYIRGNGMGGGIGSVCYMERPADISSASQDVQDFYDNLGYGTGNPLVAEYYAYNAVGSVVANTDQQGFVIRENDFDAYGNQVREQDWTSDNFPTEFGGSQNDLLFSTKERDFSTGLDYFGFRYYDAVLGKFTTRDPIGYPDGPNNYLYVNNNPINSIDPLGLLEKDPKYYPYEPKAPEVETPKGPKTDTPKGPQPKVDDIKSPKKSPKVGPKSGPKGGPGAGPIIILEQSLDWLAEEYEKYQKESENWTDTKKKADGIKFALIMALQNSDMKAFIKSKNKGETPDMDAFGHISFGIEVTKGDKSFFFTIAGLRPDTTELTGKYEHDLNLLRSIKGVEGVISPTQELAFIKKVEQGEKVDKNRFLLVKQNLTPKEAMGMVEETRSMIKLQPNYSTKPDHVKSHNCATFCIKIINSARPNTIPQTSLTSPSMGRVFKNTKEKYRGTSK